MSEELLLKRMEVVGLLLKKGVLISSELLIQITDEQKLIEVYNSLKEYQNSELLVLNNDTNRLITRTNTKDVNWIELERHKASSERGKDKSYQKFMDTVSDSTSQNKIYNEGNQQKPINIIFSYEEPAKKRDVQDFVDYFNNRYKQLASILRNRLELSKTTSISKILGKKDKEQAAIIGMVVSKQHTKKGNLMLSLEDQSGHMNIIVNKSKSELYNSARDIVMDEVIGVVGVSQGSVMFANNLLWPDVPTNNELKKSEDEYYIAFLSDLHVGSSKFLPDDFEKFLKWINGEMGNEAQREIAKKIPYIFIGGDLIDGCGIYPDQDKELSIPNVYEQYEECARLLDKIPKKIQLIICPGNHDAIRIAEPQPPLSKTFAKPLYGLPNAIFVSNPSLVNIGRTNDFTGFNILMYHGYSFDFFVSEVDSLRNNGGYGRGDLIMKFLLQRRHLAPSHTSTLYTPEVKKDFLVIEQIPDFFLSGHIHKSITANYRNVTLISGSCWQSKTAFQEKVGHNPEPSRVPVINTKTREIKILKFGQ